MRMQCNETERKEEEELEKRGARAVDEVQVGRCTIHHTYGQEMKKRRRTLGQPKRKTSNFIFLSYSLLCDRLLLLLLRRRRRRNTSKS